MMILRKMQLMKNLLMKFVKLKKLSPNMFFLLGPGVY